MLTNVTPTDFDHVCRVCGKAEQSIAYARLRRQTKESGKQTLHYVCERHGPGCQRASAGYCGVDTGCIIHVESFNGDIPLEQQDPHSHLVRALYAAVEGQP